MNVKKSLNMVVAVLVFVFIVSGVSFAYYVQVVKGNDESSRDVVESVNDLRLTIDSTSTFNIKANDTNMMATTTFSVTNNGKRKVNKYQINASSVINDFVRPEELVYKITCTSSKGVECMNVDETVFPVVDSPILTSNVILPNETHNYKITVWLKDTGSVQNYNLNKHLAFKITIGKYNKSLITEKLMNSNDLKLVSTELGNAYYLNSSKYITFSGLLFRIVKMNEDGSIRLILNDSISNDLIAEWYSNNITGDNVNYVVASAYCSKYDNGICSYDYLNYGLLDAIDKNNTVLFDGVHPVINIISTSEAIGDGTFEDPYELVSYSDLLSDNILASEGGINSIKKKGITTINSMSGVYSLNDNSGDTYYFYGSNSKYISFAGHLFKIVRINGDGSVRVVLSSSARDTKGNVYNVVYNNKETCKRVNDISESIECIKYDNSYIKEKVNEWFNNNISGTNLNYIVSSKYCNNLKYRGNEFNNDLVFTCDNELTLNVGLMSNTEAKMLNISNVNPSWTMSPSKVVGNQIFMDTFGQETSIINSSCEFSPVINIKKDVRVTGSGSLNNPYVLKTSN